MMLNLCQQILAMIEEAAGTMMYESKKQQAQKTIAKKDSKLKEINDVSIFCDMAKSQLVDRPLSLQILNEEITPTLTKLKEERSTYLEFQKIQRELEHLTKLYIAHKFVTAEETADKMQTDMGDVNKEMDELKQLTEGKTF
jgi:structural maintenance of chromosome 2